MDILFFFLILENIFEKIIPSLRLFDEILTIIFLIVILARFNRLNTHKNNVKLILSILAIILIGIASTIIFNVQQEIIAVIKDILAFSKFYLSYLFGSLILRDGISEKKFKRICKFSKMLISIMFFLGCLNLITDINMSSGYRVGIRAFIFLYSHATFLATSTAIMCAILITDGVWKNKIYIALGFIVLIFSMRSKVIIFIIASIVLYYISKRYKDKNKILSKKNMRKLAFACIITILVTFILVKDKIYLYIGYGLVAARPALYIIGFRIMLDYFPFGTGFGSFASYISGEYYSPLYKKYGIHYVSGLEKSTGFPYISDTYWPYIIGQFGLFGIILYIYSLILILKNILRIYGKRKEALVAALSIFAYAIASCFVESIMTNANSIIIALAISYYLNIKKGSTNSNEPY